MHNEGTAEEAKIVHFGKPLPDRCSQCNKPFIKKMRANDPAYCCQKCAGMAKVRAESKDV